MKKKKKIEIKKELLTINITKLELKVAFEFNLK